PLGSTVASGGAARPVKFWDPATGLVRGTFQRHTHAVLALAFSADGRTLATGSASGVVLWDAATGRQERASFRVAGRQPTHALAVFPRGGDLAAGGAGKTGLLWGTARTGGPTSRPPPLAASLGVGFTARGKLRAVGAVLGLEGKPREVEVFGVDIRMVATTVRGFDKQAPWRPFDLRLWDEATGRQRALFSARAGESYAVALGG